MNIIGYTRVSTEDQGRSGLGLDAQVKAITDECAHRGWVLARTVQDVCSGSSTKRPGLQDAIRACEDGEADGIIVTKIDRLSRSVLDFTRLVERARKPGRGLQPWIIVATDLGVDLSSPNGKFIANMLAAIAEFERAMIGQRTKDALAAARRRGIKPGPKPAVLDPSTRELIHLLRAEGASLRAIAEKLNVERVPTLRGKQWHAASVARVLDGVPSAS